MFGFLLDAEIVDKTGKGDWRYTISTSHLSDCVSVILHQPSLQKEREVNIGYIHVHGGIASQKVADLLIAVQVNCLEAYRNFLLHARDEIGARAVIHEYTLICTSDSSLQGLYKFLKKIFKTSPNLFHSQITKFPKP